MALYTRYFLSLMLIEKLERWVDASILGSSSGIKRIFGGQGCASQGGRAQGDSFRNGNASSLCPSERRQIPGLLFEPTRPLGASNLLLSVCIPQHRPLTHFLSSIQH